MSLDIPSNTRQSVRRYARQVLAQLPECPSISLYLSTASDRGLAWLCDQIKALSTSAAVNVLDDTDLIAVLIERKDHAHA